MDMFDMKAFEDASFDVVLDKGTMDAILVRSDLVTRSCAFPSTDLLSIILTIFY